jgi:sn-glycerol 3-phosphate transport system ATP-binding protein/multiple sugar transport system ATP-binding protein
MNFLDARIESERQSFFASRGEVRVGFDPKQFRSATPRKEVTLGVRPHDVEVAPHGRGFPLQVSIVEVLGAESYAHGTLAGSPFVARVDVNAGIRKGDTVPVEFSTIHLFDRQSGVTLRR